MDILKSFSSGTMRDLCVNNKADIKASDKVWRHPHVSGISEKHPEGINLLLSHAFAAFYPDPGSVSNLMKRSDQRFDF